ncbi:MAG: GNAT family N-acetyltransferase [Actinomycetota bacterium]|nr:GNAT family N-acetyltransferase [Actinomycetota bacterium]
MKSEADQRNLERPTLVLRGSGVSCRVQQWSYQPTTAQLVLYQQAQLPSLTDLQQWGDRLRSLGYTTVRTTALAATAAHRAEAAGYRCIQELVLLAHVEPSRSRRIAGLGPLAATHRLATDQHVAASAIDLAAFGTDWALDAHAIDGVCTATPRHRARSAGSPSGAYAISGRDAKQGFLQRLAVHPTLQRQGLGRALVHDSLQWAARWRVQRVLVNTPVDNEPALALYEQFGFRRLGEQLRVYELELR